MSRSDQKADQFYRLVGHSITAWAKVEEWLFEMCWRSLGSSKERAAIVYFKTPGLEARISLVDELVKSVLPKPDRRDGGHPHAEVIAWANLRKRIQDQLATRRRIAHHPVRRRRVTVESYPLAPLPPPEERKPGVDYLRVAHGIDEVSWLEMYVSENERLRGRSSEEMKPLRSDEVQTHSLLVTDLAGEVMNFHLNVLLKRLG